MYIHAMIKLIQLESHPTIHMISFSISSPSSSLAVLRRSCWPGGLLFEWIFSSVRGAISQRTPFVYMNSDFLGFPKSSFIHVQYIPQMFQQKSVWTVSCHLGFIRRRSLVLERFHRRKWCLVLLLCAIIHDKLMGKNHFLLTSWKIFNQINNQHQLVGAMWNRLRTRKVEKRKCFSIKLFYTQELFHYTVWLNQACPNFPLWKCLRFLYPLLMKCKFHLFSATDKMF